MTDQPIVIVGGLGKTGVRVRDRLAARGIATRAASRGTRPGFDWTERASWGPALAGAAAAYVAYQPDLAVPRAGDDIAAFAEAAAAAGVGHVVLLSGRGEDNAVASEARLRAGPVAHTILRAAWFAENFSEGAFRDGIVAGALALPAGPVREPFVSVEDIADAAVLALTDPRHRGRTYDLTGPRLLSFADAVAEVAAAIDRPLAYETVPLEGFIAELRTAGVDDETLWLMGDLFANTLDGRNASVSFDLFRLLGRRPRDFATVVAEAAASGAWATAKAPMAGISGG
jgi:uncharacterized protein YbjT (DUF2867 family)